LEHVIFPASVVPIRVEIIDKAAHYRDVMVTIGQVFLGYGKLLQAESELILLVNQQSHPSRTFAMVKLHWEQV
jgi:hypothetical protein